MTLIIFSSLAFACITRKHPAGMITDGMNNDNYSDKLEDFV